MLLSRLSILCQADKNPFLSSFASQKSDQFAVKYKKFDGSRRKNHNLTESLLISRRSATIVVRGLQDDQEDKWLREEKRWIGRFRWPFMSW